jgi:hypothetical protein
VEPDYLPDSEVCFSHAWTPFPNGGCGGDFPPHNCHQGGPGGGGDNFCRAPPPPPPSGGFGGTPEVKYWEKFPCKIL